MKSENLSRYAVQLDQRTQQKVEAKNLTDQHSDVLLMSADDFVTHFHEYLRTDVELYFSRYGAFMDQDENRYHLLQFVMAEVPRITANTGAFPCSLVMAFDGSGNFAVVHMTRYLLFWEPPKIPGRMVDIPNRPAIKSPQDGRLLELQKFVTTQMDPDARILISGTNTSTELQLQITDSIKAVFAEEVAEKIETFHVDGQRLYADANKPEGYPINTLDRITSVYFFPGAYTRDGKNKVILIGEIEGAPIDASDWLSSRFAKQFENKD